MNLSVLPEKNRYSYLVSKIVGRNKKSSIDSRGKMQHVFK